MIEILGGMLEVLFMISAIVEGEKLEYISQLPR